MTEEPRDEEQKPVTSAEQKEVEEFEADPALAHPQFHGHPAWEVEETSKWPLYVGFGALVALVAVVLIVGWNNMPLPPQSPTTPTEVTAVLVTGAKELGVGWAYLVSAPTPIVGKAGGSEKAAGTKMLPGTTKIGILKSEMVGDVKWYYVKAYDGIKKNLMAMGWVSSAWLEGQDLQRIGSFNMGPEPSCVPESDRP